MGIFTDIKDRKGFTLVEIVIVMAIIAILAALVVGAIGIARKQARDTQRINDMRTLQTAMEAYASSHGGKYYDTGGKLVCLGVPSTEQCWGGPYGSDALNTALAPYLANIPKDPLYGTRIFGTYVYRSPGSYWLSTGAQSGNYSLAFAPDDYPQSSCAAYTWGAWDMPPGGVHCPPDGTGWCRQCGYLAK